MARGAITVYSTGRPGQGGGLDRTSLVATTGDATNGHTVPNDGRTYLEVKNTNGASTSRNFIVTPRVSVDGQAVTPISDPIAAGKTIVYGPYPPSIYGASLLVDVSHAEVTILAFRLANA